MNKLIEDWPNQVCDCGCNKSYPIGYAEPCGWKKLSENSVMRLTDKVVFSVGDVIEKITEQGKSYGCMVINAIDFYFAKDHHHINIDNIYIRADRIKTKDNKLGSCNITDTLTDYTSADNPNTLRFIQHLNYKKEVKKDPIEILNKEQQFEIFRSGFVIANSGTSKGKSSVDCFNEWFKNNNYE